MLLYICVLILLYIGVKIEAVMAARADNISLDDLARVATDIHTDRCCRAIKALFRRYSGSIQALLRLY